MSKDPPPKTKTKPNQLKILYSPVQTSELVNVPCEPHLKPEEYSRAINYNTQLYETALRKINSLDTERRLSYQIEKTSHITQKLRHHYNQRLLALPKTEYYANLFRGGSQTVTQRKDYVEDLFDREKLHLNERERRVKFLQEELQWQRSHQTAFNTAINKLDEYISLQPGPPPDTDASTGKHPRYPGLSDGLAESKQDIPNPKRHKQDDEDL